MHGISAASRQQLIGLVLHVLQSARVQWRHHGVGMIQGYIDEGGPYETRVHVWHPELIYPDLIDRGDIHDHRFHFQSTVLVGELHHNLFRATPAVDGDYVSATVIPARQKQPDDSEFAIQGRCAIAMTDTLDVKAGWEYTFSKRMLHRAWANELTVTVVTKYEQEEIPATVVGQPPLLPAFREQDADLIERIKDEACTALQES